MATKTIKIPDIGGATDVEVIEINVAVGDTVNEQNTLVVLETDKASMEIPSSASGTVTSIALKEGDLVAEGHDILVLETAKTTTENNVSKSEKENTSESEKKEVPVEEKPAKTDTQVNTVQTTITEDETPVIDNKQVHAGPAVRTLAREFGVDLSQISGSGPKQRILKEDVQAFVKKSLTQPAASGTGQGTNPLPIADIDFSQFGDVEKTPMSKIHKLTAQNMQRSWLNVPHVTQFDEANITELESFRKTLKAEAEKRGVKVTPLPFLLKACALALREYPQFNVSLHSDGQHIIQKHYVHIGIAVDTPAGLVVPVIRDVDKKNIWQLSAEIITISSKAKNKKLTTNDMQGGCFTISSLGSIGGTAFTPIINAPEVAILGVARASMKPQWNGNEFIPKLMLPLCLSYDHRAINGADAARFVSFLNKILGDIRHIVMG